MDETGSFGQWIRARRRALHLTQRSLGDVVGLTAGMIRKIEADERRPSHATALRLAEALQVAEAQRRAVVRFARGEAGRTAIAPEAALPSSGGVLQPVDAPDEHELVHGDTQALAALRQTAALNAAPLERLLIEHIARCWVRLCRAEQEYTAQSLNAVSVEQAAAWEHRLTATHERYLHALQTLAWVRHLPHSMPVDVTPAASGDSG